MKRLIVLSAALLLGSNFAFADITINLTAGVLSLSNGNPIPSGSLLQLVASTTDNIFTSPTPGSFTGGSSDDVIIASFSSNTFAGGPGDTANSITFTLSGNLTPGDQIMLRWWPSLTTGSSSPGSGTSFGQFRTDAVENGSDIAWVVPSDGATVSLNFETTSFGGTEPDTAGRASFTVAPIPEPSTFALMIAGAVGFLALRSRSRR